MLPPSKLGMAERVGFEPTVPLPGRMLSKHVDSSTLAPLRDSVREEAHFSMGGGQRQDEEKSGSHRMRLATSFVPPYAYRRTHSGEPMPDEQQDERRIARVTVLADPRFLPALTDLLADIAGTVGLNEEAARKLDSVLDEIFRNVLEQGYRGDTGQSIDVIVSQRNHTLVVAIED